MNFNTLLEYLYSNSIPVLEVDRANDSDDILDCSVITVNDNLSVMFYDEEGTAQVIGPFGDDARIMDTTDRYLTVVANVKSLLPPRGEGNLGFTL